MVWGKKKDKKCLDNSISYLDLYIGGKVTVNARVLTIIEFADTNTQDKLASKNERYSLPLSPCPPSTSSLYSLLPF